LPYSIGSHLCINLITLFSAFLWYEAARAVKKIRRGFGIDALKATLHWQ